MTEQVKLSTIIVVDNRSFEVSAYQLSPRSMLLTVILDGMHQWSFEVAGWRPWSGGASCGELYLWSARQLLMFPKSLDTDPTRIDFDEDLLFAFRLDLGWVFVCETSVRLSADSGDVARVEFGEVLESARWHQDHLIVRDLSGLERSILVSADALLVEAVD
jgi:hypothetical protein